MKGLKDGHAARSCKPGIQTQSVTPWSACFRHTVLPPLCLDLGLESQYQFQIFLFFLCHEFRQVTKLCFVFLIHKTEIMISAVFISQCFGEYQIGDVLCKALCNWLVTGLELRFFFQPPPTPTKKPSGQR